MTRPTLSGHNPLKFLRLDREYDGLKLLRVDERYDDDNPTNGIDGSDPWRTVEASTYGPGIVGNLLAKRVYTHTNNDATPDATTDYYYAYDHVGNVYMIFDANGEEEYRFNQDAFGNELNFEGYAGSSWATAAAAGIAEHQTGKWIDPFSGLYFFSARWYDSGVGRFLSRDSPPDKQINQSIAPTHGVLSPIQFTFNFNNPINRSDPDGRVSFALPGTHSECWGYLINCPIGRMKTCVQFFRICNYDFWPMNSTWGNCVRNCLLDQFDLLNTPCEDIFNHLACWTQCPYPFQPHPIAMPF